MKTTEKVNPLTLEAFADWCDTKGDEKYKYIKRDKCALAQYAKHINVNNPYNTQEVNYDKFWFTADHVAIHVWKIARVEGRFSKFEDVENTFRELAEELRRFDAKH